ncbi:hypothetical protein CJD36_010955 [Flavipsychrobacter stenotrophus]|uniref:RHS repeat-associated core domain-containing protein n=1 Tax=Flavipsychrobacter stenotrophus TaxID=2077091 RepID=A0A2S7SV32_9BACT|nr:RHS repeat-associated core domain-containing protein [Flavipsychrobacter stenotrophus]PQJ10487.1 hypothetical protein CJD36_010955 [Flavipsychrobacter stenotrophus]
MISTGTGVSWPMGDGGDDPVGGPGPGNPADGDVLVTATVRDGVFNVSVVDDSTGKNLGNVVISSGDNNGTIKIHYSGGGHGTSLHITLDNAGNDNNINISAIRVPHYTYVPQSVVSRVCNGESYRYGFNGKYKDNEWAGKGNSYDYGFRQYDTRIARFRTVDPLTAKYPMLTPYQFASNNPIMNIDLDGLEGFPANATKGANGEMFVRSRVQLVKGWDIYEQITIRPAGTSKAFNTRVDFLLRSQSTDNVYTIDVKTGGGRSSTNQLTFDKSIENGDLTEMRSAKPNGGTPVNGKLRVAGNVVVRISDNGELIVEKITPNPNSKGSDEIVVLGKKISQTQKENSNKNNQNNGSGMKDQETLMPIVPLINPVNPTPVPTPIFEVPPTFVDPVIVFP